MQHRNPFSKEEFELIDRNNYSILKLITIFTA